MTIQQARWGSQEDDRVVLITGAGNGIGLALTQSLLQSGKRLVLTARASSLPRFAALGIEETERIMIRPLDVTRCQEADVLVAEVTARWGGVNVLVNNAAICYRAVIEHLADQHEIDQFQTNYLGPLHLTRLVLPQMRARRCGHIINLSSVGGMMAMPTMGGYSSSKFALEGASEALWYEMRPWGVRVTLIEPGFVNSDSFKNARFTALSQASFDDPGEVYHPYYANMMALVTRMMNRSPTTPEDIACIIVKTMNQKRPPLRKAATWDAVFFSLMRRLLPQRLYHRILYWGLPHIRDWVP